MSVALVTASAGTGKTHFVVGEVVAALTETDAPVAPEHIVAVTYTRVAAAELQERIRRALMANGEVDLARRIQNARIGTVHAVCQGLVEDFAFELGLAPKLKTIDDRVAEQTLARVIQTQLTSAELARADELSRRMREMSGFPGHVKALVDHARKVGMAPEVLRYAGERGRARLSELLPAAKSAAAIEKDMLDATARYLQRSEDGQRPRGELPFDVRIAREVHDGLTQHAPTRWQAWLSLCTNYTIKAAAEQHVFHPQLSADLLEAHDLLFAIAARSLESYAETKRAWGVVDFVDQELHALTLLRRSDLRARLSESVDFVVVDELQDSSPQQLEVFRELSSLARRSIWVGDRKQSIYSFRGADPALMNEALAVDVTERVAPLTVSYRSRGDLVAVTSAVFEQAFARHDPEAGTANITSAAPRDDQELGPVLEWWQTAEQGDHYDGGTEATQHDAIASGVVSLLNDETARVRQPNLGAARRPRCGDICVLVRTNDVARKVASSLQAAGLAAQWRRFGLMGTVEARMVSAGLRLWIDGTDALAAAEIARVLVYPDDIDAVMQLLVPGPTGPAVCELALVKALVATARTHVHAGVVSAVDHVIEALQLGAWAARVNDTQQRQANLSAVRALAVRTVARLHAQGRGATIASFIARLVELSQQHDDDDDRQGSVVSVDAVTVTTWHGSKGLEWPIVVLAELAYRAPKSVFGLHVERGQGGEQWPRYWLSPYTRKQARLRVGLNDVLKASAEFRRADREVTAEELRLLYVAWTRARDRLVLAGTPDAFRRGILSVLGLSAPEGPVRWAGVDVRLAIRRLVREPLAPPQRRPTVDFAPPQQRIHAPASVQPSSSVGRGTVEAYAILGAPIVPRVAFDDDTGMRFGTCVHALLAVDRPTTPVKARLSCARQLLMAHRVDHIADETDLLAVADRLWAHLQAQWPAHHVQAEVPVSQRFANGTVVRGQIDLLLTTATDAIVIDHKTYALGVDDSLDKAPEFAGQLRMYAAAAGAALGRPVSATYVHMPLSALFALVR